MSIFSRRKGKAAPPRQDKPRPTEARTEKTQPETSRSIPARLVGTEFIRWPLLTEKATGLQASNKYVFVVTGRASKTEIKKEVARLFDVKAEKVSVINRKSKRRMWRGRVGRRPGYKKVIVTIEAGKKIEVLPT